MRESSFSRGIGSLSISGISAFVFAAAFAMTALFFLMPHAAARELPLQKNGVLADWQRYAAWHPSWHYLAVQDEECESVGP